MICIDCREDDSSFTFSVSRDNDGLRVDHFLVEHLQDYSRTQLAQFVKKGLVSVNGSPVKASHRLKHGDEVNGHIKAVAPLTVEPQKIDFDIVYEDQYLIGISKPPGLVVHPADGNPDNTLVNGLVYHCAKMQDVGDPVRPGIVHRLDKDTSGIIVAAKNNTTHRQLVDLFKSRQVRKTYLAIVAGVMDDDSGRIVAPIGRHPVNRKKMAIRDRVGKYAATNWWVEEILKEQHSLLKIEIETGRTHQIRVHMASVGTPVAGDAVYGRKKKSALFARQMLHSSEIHFLHPVSGKKIRLQAPLWPDMQNALRCLGAGSEDK